MAIDNRPPCTAPRAAAGSPWRRVERAACCLSVREPPSLPVPRVALADLRGRSRPRSRTPRGDRASTGHPVGAARPADQSPRSQGRPPSRHRGGRRGSPPQGTGSVATGTGCRSPCGSRQARFDTARRGLTAGSRTASAGGATERTNDRAVVHLGEPISSGSVLTKRGPASPNVIGLEHGAGGSGDLRSEAASRG